MSGFDTEALARSLKRDDFAELRRLIESLKNELSAPAILQGLARDNRAEVRSWAAGVAEETVGSAALPWLLEMARGDRDRENRSLALHVILAIDAEAVHPLLPRLRKQLREGDVDYASDAARALTSIGFKEALPDMRALAQRWEPGIYYRKRLEIYMMVLEGSFDLVYQRIRAHDHAYMTWLADAAATFIRTPEAQAVLEWASQDLPDEECRRICAAEARKGRKTP